MAADAKYCYYPLCKQIECICRYYVKDAQAPFDVKKVWQNKLFICRLNNELSWTEHRERFIAIMNPITSVNVFVDKKGGYATISFANHTLASAAQQKLTMAGYSAVTFLNKTKEEEEEQS